MDDKGEKGMWMNKHEMKHKQGMDVKSVQRRKKSEGYHYFGRKMRKVKEIQEMQL